MKFLTRTSWKCKTRSRQAQELFLKDTTFRKYYLKVIRGDCQDICSRVVQKILYLLSQIYGFIVKTRIFFYKKGILKSTHLPVPVISVGNITMGGTGKTPVVEYISRYLQDKGKRVAILSRGYAAHIRQENGSPVKNAYNDEYLLFQENIPNVPNLLGKDRVKSGLAAIEHFQAEYLLLDDGFQYLRLARDLNIAIVDVLNPFGYDRIIPGGMLREPLEELRRADLIMLTHVDQCSIDRVNFIRNRIQKISEHTPFVETVHKPVCLESAKDSAVLNINCLRGKRVFAFCAIGNPASFRKSIEGLGTTIVNLRIFPDHHLYTVPELRALNKEAHHVAPDAIIITQKDRVKIRNNIDIWDFPLWTLKVEIRIVKGCEIFENKINTILQQ